MARRLLAVALLTFVVALVSLPLGATTTTGAGGETATTGAGAETATTGAGAETATTEAGAETATTEATTPAVTLEPAVPVDTTPAPVTNPDWTYRFFIPTLLVLTVLVVIVTVIQYFTRVVRNRYRIVR
jgi:hypothetical protein